MRKYNNVKKDILGNKSMNNATVVRASESNIVDSRVDSRAGKYLTFFLSNEEYGVEILKVQEIIGRMPITPVPLTSKYIRGVINLRGKIHPIMDLNVKFGMNQTQITDETCIIVIKTSSLMMGILVDKVSEVIKMASENIEDAPSFGTDVNSEYLSGIGKTGGRICLLLDIEKVIMASDIINMKKAAESSGQRPKDETNQIQTN
jgi:purine-binding chemotaxis protein CheW